MAVEQLLASLWELDGYLTKTRVPYKVTNGYSDMDVVGVNCDFMRIGECKARFDAKTVMVVTEGAENFHHWLGDWAKFTSQIDKFWENDIAWRPKRNHLKKLEIWFCANIFFESEKLRNRAGEELLEGIYDILPHGLRSKTSVVVTSTFDVILEILKILEKRYEENGWNKRYGIPILDTFRELLRFLRCGKTVYGERTITREDVKQKSSEKLNQLLEICKYCK